MKIVKVNRRDFLKNSALTSAVLVLGATIPISLNEVTASENTHGLNTFVSIDSMGNITISVPTCEMGQGIFTAMPMIIAEEMDADFSRVKPIMGASQMTADQAEKNFANPWWGTQLNGGGVSMMSFFTVLQNLGASARFMLLSAASENWGVPASECTVADSIVKHPSSARKASFGSLALSASKINPPAEPTPKSPDQYRLIGHSPKRLDTPSKINGSAQFGIDVDLPGMLTGVVKFAPVMGGQLKHQNTPAALATNGVKKIVEIPEGVVVVADSFWQATLGMEALDPQFNSSPASSTNSSSIQKNLNELLQKEEGEIVRNVGDVGESANVQKILTSEFFIAPQSQAPMEPMSATADFQDDFCEVWASTQGPGPAAYAISLETGLPLNKIKINQTFLGGGFGRRIDQDFVMIAALASKALKKPVKVIWPREEDMTHGYFHPPVVGNYTIGLNENKEIVSWEARVAGTRSMNYGSATIWREVLAKGLKQVPWFGADASHDGGFMRLGLMADSPFGGIWGVNYDLPNIKIHKSSIDIPGLRTGYWRGVDAFSNTFMIESMLDEVAQYSNKDPFILRKELLHNEKRELAVLDMLEEKSEWQRPQTSGHFRGMALSKHHSGAITAQVAEISVDSRNNITVHRVINVTDLGTAIHPNIVRQQLGGGIIFALNAVIKSEIHFEAGQVVEKNFDEYAMMKMKDTPIIDIHLLDGGIGPGPVGESSGMAIGPAVANAVFAATGKRVRRLPIRKEDLI